MKRLALLCFAMLMLLCAANAQNSGRMKLANIIAEHEEELQAKKQSNTGHLKTTSNKDEEFEGEKYQFDRWLWWAKQNTDKDGYIVSDAEAWKLLNKDVNANNTQYKTTATSQSDWSLKGITSNTGLFLGYYGNGQGRINTMEFHPTDKNTFWVGTSSGGAWKTTNFGTTWTCMTDNLPHVVAVGDIKINPLNPNTIYLCTGDADGFFVVNEGGAGVGLLKSTDGGLTWKTTGLSNNIVDGVYTNKIIFNPSDTNKLVCATSQGIYQSNDGGVNWFTLYDNSDVSPGFTLKNVWDIAYAPGDSNRLYMCASAVNLLNNEYAYIYKRLNGTGAFNGIVEGNVSRTRLALTTPVPNVVYYITSYGMFDQNRNGAIHKVVRSVDKLNNAFVAYDKSTSPGSGNILGADFNGTSIGGQGYYDLAMAIDPLDAYHIVVGGINAWESFNGGVSWQLFNQWKADAHYNTPVIHADKHFMTWHPLDNSYFFECNDGGIFYKKNGVWTNITPGLAITQFYRNAVSGNGQFALGGAQDNGTQFLNLTGSSHQIGFGDGTECQVNQSNKNIVYWSSQYGNIFRYNISQPIDSTAEHYIRDNIPHVNRGAWITPYLLEPLYQKTIIAGFDTVFMSVDSGENWVPISDKLGRTNMYRLAMTPANAGTIYAVEDNDTNAVYVTHSYGTPGWTTINHSYQKKRISDIKVDSKDKDHFWISFSGWNNTATVAEYNNGTWNNISQNLPAEPIYCLEVDSSDGTLYAGTYDGVYFRPVDSTVWTRYSSKLPHVSVYDLGIDYSSGQLIAATWGRGMWSSPKYVKPLGIYAGVPCAYKQLDVYPNPSTDKFTVTTEIPEFNNNEVTVQMVNVKGEVVYNKQHKFCDTKLELTSTDLANGVYVINVTGKYGIDAKARVVITK